MTRYVWHDGAWHRAMIRPPGPPVFPGIIRDHMTPAMHPCTGQVLDSKSAFRAITKANGCVELGNDVPLARPVYQVDRKELREDIAEAVQMVEQGYEAPRAEAAADDVRIYGK